MLMKTCTANKITQATGTKYAKFNNLNNLMNTNNRSVAKSNLVRGKTLTPNRPATLTLTNFKCNLPSEAIVKKIRVRSCATKVPPSGWTSCCEPGQATISVIGVSGLDSRKGATITKSEHLASNTWNVNVSASVVNSENFGFKFDLPTNLNNIRGYVYIQNLYLEIYYELPEYELTLNKLSGESQYDDFEVSATLSNKTDTPYVPLVSLSIPDGFIVEDFTTKGNLILSGGTAQWTPSLKGISSDTLLLRLSTDIDFGTSDTYVGTFTIVENYTPTTKTLNVTVARYEEVDVEEIVSQDKAIKGEDNQFKFYFTDEEMERILLESDEGYVQFKYLDLNETIQSVSVALEDWSANNMYECVMNPTTVGVYTVKVGYYTDTTLAHHFQQSTVEVIPTEQNCKDVSYTVLVLTDEELDRLGHGQVYTAQTFLKILPVNETRVRDWKYNFRIGVFNEAISENITNYEYINSEGEMEDITVDSTDYENLTVDEIISNAVWSNPPEEVNVYTNLSCNFRYNKDYPLYIILSGDNFAELSSSQMANTRFTEPVISETAYYKGAEPNGTFPVPILNTIGEDDPSIETIYGLNSGNTLIFTNFNFDHDLTSEYVIRGILVGGDVGGEDIALSAKFINQGNETRVKSIVLQDTSEFALGGYGDLWGFKTKDIQSFNDCEIHLTPSNTILSEALLELNNVAVTLYLEEIGSNVIQCFIEDEDISYYGVFLTDLEIPEGLQTSTKYITIPGSDVNDPYQQTIQEKPIELEFDFGSTCDIEGNTFAMRQFTKLLVNERDKYNKPIPKKIRFSHYPDVYWEYILEDGYTPELEVGSYKVKVKLTVPSGVALSSEETVSTNQGYVDGLTFIHPVIVIKPFDSLINITDLESKQIFNLGYSDFTGKSIRIDCNTHKVYLEDNEGNSKDITKYVDANSDWFRLYGYFNLQCSGGIIQTVTYTEKW